MQGRNASAGALRLGDAFNAALQKALSLSEKAPDLLLSLKLLDESNTNHKKHRSLVKKLGELGNVAIVS